jgi:DNA gyrase subunit B
MTQSQEYTSAQIDILEGLDHIRMRPAMYIGSTGVGGLHQLAWEIIDNAVDEALAGCCHNIEIVLNQDGSLCVIDDGRGIPVDIHPKSGMSALATVLTTPGSGGKFGSGSYKVSSGLHGVGASAVTALSAWLRAIVWRNGFEYSQDFQVKQIGPLTERRNVTKPNGTSITFMPDAEIFETVEFNFDTLRSRIRELAFLNFTVTALKSLKLDTFISPCHLFIS